MGYLVAAINDDSRFASSLSFTSTTVSIGDGSSIEHTAADAATAKGHVRPMDYSPLVLAKQSRFRFRR